MTEEPVHREVIASPEFERLLDSQEAALLMRVHPETLKRLARGGKVAAVKLGRVWRFRASALEECFQTLLEESPSHVRQTMALSQTAVCAVRNRRK